MMPNEIYCSAWKLYVILDAEAVGDRDLAQVAQLAVRGGADVIQLRDKRATTNALVAEATRVVQITRAARIPLIINDRADVARAVQADGVHLGHEDLPVGFAKSLLGPGRIVGRSTHSLDEALEAQRAGADYVAVGPVYPTPTKPDYPSVGLELIGRIKAVVKRPIVCIGGIDQTTLPAILQAGGECVAVVRAVCAAEDPEEAARSLKRLLLDYGVRHR
jgi:thiamine-phosphate pyrophosphorylase